MPWLTGALEADGVVGIRWNDSGSHRDAPAARAVGEVAATPGRGPGLRRRSHPRQVARRSPAVSDLWTGFGQPAPSHLLKGTTAIVLKFASSTLTAARRVASVPSSWMCC